MPITPTFPHLTRDCHQENGTLCLCQWMKTNMKKLNDDKTEILIIHPKSEYQHILPEGVQIRNIHVIPNMHARNLGLTFDSNMSLERHVTNISRTAYYHLHSIIRICRYLEQGHTKQLVHALVISRIDCCNSLLNGLSVAMVEKLHVQNACHTNSIKMRPCHAHTLGAAVKSRITFNTLLLTFKCLHGLADLRFQIYQHFSLPIAQHAVYTLLLSYLLNSPLPELKSPNDPSPVQLQGHGTNLTMYEC